MLLTRFNLYTYVAIALNYTTNVHVANPLAGPSSKSDALRINIIWAAVSTSSYTIFYFYNKYQNKILTLLKYMTC